MDTHSRRRSSSGNKRGSLSPAALAPSTALATSDARPLAKFQTQTPQLASERAQHTALGAALERLHALTTSDAWRNKLAGSTHPSSTSSTRSHSVTPDTAIDADLEAFFVAELAPAIQARESALVNVLHECFTTELASQQQQQSQTDARAQQQTHAHWQSKLDRRVAETNALRKDFYKQLLMLRELVNKQKNDPKTLKVLDDALATMSMTKDQAAAFRATGAGAPGTLTAAAALSSKTGTSGAPSSSSSASSSTSSSAQREREKWEERAREAALECQQLQEQVLQLKHENEALRASDVDGWFAHARGGLGERQRVLDAVYRGKCTWSDVGAAVLEVLNNDLIWDAVETSARESKPRVSRGLEALIAQLNALDPTGDLRLQQPQLFDSAGDSDAAATAAPVDTDSISRRLFGHRRSSSDPVRLIQCRACNGAGFLDPSSSDADTSDSDSYLRKTLAQVLELRASLEAASERSVHLEQELARTVADAAGAQRELAQIESTRRLSVARSVQVDLDDEDDARDVVDLDAIMRASASLDSESAVLTRGAGDDSSSASGFFGAVRKKRGPSRREAQYEHLIVELKSSLDEKDGALRDLRAAHHDTHERLRAAQRTAQSAYDAHVHEVATLKTALSRALQRQNSAIDEKQAAVALLLQKYGAGTSTARSLASIPGVDDDGDDDDNGSGTDDSGDVSGEPRNDELDALTDGDLDALDEVKRSEVVARRYSQAIARVQREYESQKSLLEESEAAVGHADETRKRTNSIALGNIVVSLASHPRDLFQALAAAQSELLSLRRSSQRASTLQTDRLLTLTTHLGHLSEELCMVRKRTRAEIAFWKLECEKTQNASSAVASDLEKTQLELQAAMAQRTVSIGASGTGDSSTCTLCAKHHARLMEISSELLLHDTQQSLASATGTLAPSTDSTITNSATTERAPADATQLTAQERQSVSAMVLEIETLYATMSAAKQVNARQLFACALLGDDAVANSAGLQVTGSAFARRPTRTDSSVSATSPRGSTRKQSSADAAARRRSRADANARALDDALLLSEAHDEGQSIDGASVPCLGLEETPESSSTATSSASYRSSSSRTGVVVRPTGSPESGATAQQDLARGPLLVSGTALASGSQRDDIFAPNHRKKKIVRKILSEDEVLRRRYAQAQQRSASSSAVLPLDARDAPRAAPPHSPHVAAARTGVDGAVDGDSAEDTPERLDALDCVSSYVDANGLEVFYEDVEVEDDASDSDDAGGNQIEDDRSSDAALEWSRDGAPRDAAPRESDVAPVQTIALLDDRTDIASDPEVITQLRDLVKQHTSVKASLALTNWRILVFHVRALWSQNRLDWMTLESKRLHQLSTRPNHTTSASPLQYTVVRSTMQQLVEHRESVLDAEIRARDEIRRDSRRVQAHLIHSVSTILTTLSRKGKSRSGTGESDAYPPLVVLDPERTSPRRYVAYSNRTVYPTQHVDLSHIPSTQQIPTLHFPLPATPAATVSCGTIPPQQSSPRRSYLVRGRPFSAADAPRLWSGEDSDERSDLAMPEPSVFEDDNRFPQRSVRFVGPSDGYEFSLAHSLSGITRTARSPRASPVKDPSKSPTFRAGSRSASPRKRDMDPALEPHASATLQPDTVLSTERPSPRPFAVPTRPQSSPAGLMLRSFASRARDVTSSRAFVPARQRENDSIEPKDAAVRPPQTTASPLHRHHYSRS